MTITTDLMRWYHCTEEAAEHIVACATENAKLTGIPLQNDLKDIVERADMCFYNRRDTTMEMTLADVKAIQVQRRRLAAFLDEPKEVKTP